MKILIPGSFDPPTNGHLEIFKRCSILFKSVTILVAENNEKKHFMSVDLRLELIKEMVKDFSNVGVDYYNGLVVEYAKLNGFSALVRSIRNSRDYDYEAEIFRANRYISKEIDTIFLNSDSGNEGISSSLVRELIRNHVDVSRLVPNNVFLALQDRDYLY